VRKHQLQRHCLCRGVYAPLILPEVERVGK
jgi:hypothetical protein